MTRIFRVWDTFTNAWAIPASLVLDMDKQARDAKQEATGLTYCDMEGFAIEEDGTLILLDECGRYAYVEPGRFWVVWTDADH